MLIFERNYEINLLLHGMMMMHNYCFCAFLERRKAAIFPSLVVPASIVISDFLDTLNINVCEGM